MLGTHPRCGWGHLRHRGLCHLCRHLGLGCGCGGVKHLFRGLCEVCGLCHKCCRLGRTAHFRGRLLGRCCHCGHEDRLIPLCADCRHSLRPGPSDTRHEGRGTGLSTDRGSPAVRQFVQQSPYDPRTSRSRPHNRLRASALCQATFPSAAGAVTPSAWQTSRVRCGRFRV